MSAPANLSQLDSTTLVKTRSSAEDRAVMAARLEAFRNREADADAPLVIEPGGAAPTGDATVPEIPASQLETRVLKEALAGHGALIVRGLFEPSYVASLIPVIDRVLDACERSSRGDDVSRDVFFDPPPNLVDIMPNRQRELANTRRFHRDSGSAMCVEAPSVAEALLAAYDAAGIRALVADYLGEAPCLSAKKWVLRRSRLPVAEAGWHQDGAFMGPHINSLNMWVPLNDCGGNTGAPGMDVVPRRLTTLASSEGAQFDWSVSTNEAGAQTGAGVLLSPTFQPGDAFFFDHFFLHRTQYGTHFDRVRYAVETWFFGERSFPKNQIPLAW